MSSVYVCPHSPHFPAQLFFLVSDILLFNREASLAERIKGLSNPTECGVLITSVCEILRECSTRTAYVNARPGSSTFSTSTSTKSASGGNNGEYASTSFFDGDASVPNSFMAAHVLNILMRDDRFRPALLLELVYLLCTVKTFESDMLSTILHVQRRLLTSEAVWHQQQHLQYQYQGALDVGMVLVEKSRCDILAAVLSHRSAVTSTLPTMWTPPFSALSPSLSTIASSAALATSKTTLDDGSVDSMNDVSSMGSLHSLHQSIVSCFHFLSASLLTDVTDDNDTNTEREEHTAMDDAAQNIHHQPRSSSISSKATLASSSTSSTSPSSFSSASSSSSSSSSLSSASSSAPATLYYSPVLPDAAQLLFSTMFKVKALPFSSISSHSSSSSSPSSSSSSFLSNSNTSNYLSAAITDCFSRLLTPPWPRARIASMLHLVLDLFTLHITTFASQQTEDGTTAAAAPPLLPRGKAEPASELPSSSSSLLLSTPRLLIAIIAAKIFSILCASSSRKVTRISTMKPAPTSSSSSFSTQHDNNRDSSNSINSSSGRSSGNFEAVLAPTCETFSTDFYSNADILYRHLCESTIGMMCLNNDNANGAHDNGVKNVKDMPYSWLDSSMGSTLGCGIRSSSGQQLSLHPSDRPMLVRFLTHFLTIVHTHSSSLSSSSLSSPSSFQSNGSSITLLLYSLLKKSLESTPRAVLPDTIFLLSCLLDQSLSTRNALLAAMAHHTMHLLKTRTGYSRPGLAESSYASYSSVQKTSTSISCSDTPTSPRHCSKPSLSDIWNSTISTSDLWTLSLLAQSAFPMAVATAAAMMVEAWRAANANANAAAAPLAASIDNIENDDESRRDGSRKERIHQHKEQRQNHQQLSQTDIENSLVTHLITALEVPSMQERAGVVVALALQLIEAPWTSQSDNHDGLNRGLSNASYYHTPSATTIASGGNPNGSSDEAAAVTAAVTLTSLASMIKALSLPFDTSSGHMMYQMTSSCHSFLASSAAHEIQIVGACLLRAAFITFPAYESSILSTLLLGSAGLPRAPPFATVARAASAGHASEWTVSAFLQRLQGNLSGVGPGGSWNGTTGSSSSSSSSSGGGGGGEATSLAPLFDRSMYSSAVHGTEVDDTHDMTTIADSGPTVSSIAATAAAATGNELCDVAINISNSLNSIGGGIGGGGVVNQQYLTALATRVPVVPSQSLGGSILADTSSATTASSSTFSVAPGPGTAASGQPVPTSFSSSSSSSFNQDGSEAGSSAAYPNSAWADVLTSSILSSSSDVAQEEMVSSAYDDEAVTSPVTSTVTSAVTAVTSLLALAASARTLHTHHHAGVSIQAQAIPVVSLRSHIPTPFPITSLIPTPFGERALPVIAAAQSAAMREAKKIGRDVATASSSPFSSGSSSSFSAASSSLSSSASLSSLIFTAQSSVKYDMIALARERSFNPPIAPPFIYTRVFASLAAFTSSSFSSLTPSSSASVSSTMPLSSSSTSSSSPSSSSSSVADRIGAKWSELQPWLSDLSLCMWPCVMRVLSVLVILARSQSEVFHGLMVRHSSFLFHHFCLLPPLIIASIRVTWKFSFLTHILADLSS